MTKDQLIMAKKSKYTPSYNVTVSLDDGSFQTSTVENPERVPVKGESFEYTHTETRSGQVIKVERVEEDGSITTLTELSDVDHELVDHDDGDDVVLEEVLATDTTEEVADPEVEDALAANTDA